MKTTAALFLFSLLLLASAASAAEERLIPFDEFSIGVGVKDLAERERPKVEVVVRVGRNALESKSGAAIEVTSRELAPLKKMLGRDEVGALLAACTAAMSGQEYRKEVEPKTVYEVVTVDEGKGKGVRMRRDGEVLFAPEEVAWLKEMLDEAVAAEAWYKMLLTARTLPVKTRAAHPPQASFYYLRSKVGEVCGKGLVYVADLEHYKLNHKYKLSQEHAVSIGLHLDDHFRTARSPWVQRLMGQVELALEAVGKHRAFAYESPLERAFEGTGKFTVTTNLATQLAEVDIGPKLSMDLWEFSGPVQGSFGVAQLAEIRGLAERAEAQAKWFAEHEGWFFEGL